MLHERIMWVPCEGGKHGAAVTGAGETQAGKTLAVVVGGPTASGKSALALALAEAFGGVVINADSIQLYRELAILSARPSAADMARAPHRLYGVLAGSPPCSVGRWRRLALAEMAAAASCGRLPILVGGTGMYLKALTEGLAPVPPIPEAVRAEASALHARLGGPRFHDELARRDPVMAARLMPTDRQRLIRAFEVIVATGRSLAEWQRDAAAPAPISTPTPTPVPTPTPAPALVAGAGPDQATNGGPGPGWRFAMLVLEPPRDALIPACDRRMAAMIEAGAVDELRRLDALGLDPALPVMKAVGVAELRRHLRGELTLDAARALAQQATRQYAKRQRTWFRHQTPGAYRIGEQYSKSLDDEIFSFVRRFLLTATG